MVSFSLRRRICLPPPTGPRSGVLSFESIRNYDFAAEYFCDFVRDASEWLKEGRIHYREHIVDELENAPKAFIGMLNGENLGKALVRLP